MEWLVGVLSVKPHPSERILENRLRVVTLMGALLEDVYHHIPPPYAAELLRKWGRLLDGVVGKTLRMELFDLDENFGTMPSSMFASTWGWVSLVAQLLPLFECKSYFPPFKMDFYTRAARDKSGAFFCQNPVYMAALKKISGAE